MPAKDDIPLQFVEMMFCFSWSMSLLKIAPKYEATLQEEDHVNHKGEGHHNIGVAFELLEAQLDIIYMDGNVTVRVDDVEVPYED